MTPDARVLRFPSAVSATGAEDYGRFTRELSADELAGASSSPTTTAAGSRRGPRYIALDGTDHANHPDHTTQGRMIRRYIAWRNRNAKDCNLRRVVNRANVAG